MKGRIAGPRGTRDSFPPESYKTGIIEKSFQEVAHRYGYILVSTPVFENTELFSRSLGQESELVSKEMYTFPDHKGRSLTLRPEGTSGIVRALIEGNVRPEGFILKYHYSGNCYRYTAVEKGHWREFHQVGIEAFGSDSPYLDVEVISLATTFLDELGIGPYIVSLNSSGSSNRRGDYMEKLKGFLYLRRDILCLECQHKTLKNPLSAFACKQNQCREAMKEAPRMLDSLADEDKRHFNTVHSSLESLNIPCKLDPLLVKAFAYYTRTVFEIHPAGETSGRDPLITGGRYDDLFKLLGGEQVPAVGFAGNSYRIAEILPEEKNFDMSRLIGGELLVLATDEAAYSSALNLALELRKLRFCAAFDILAHPTDYQLKRATQYGVKRVILVGQDEVRDGNVIVWATDKNQRWIMPGDKFKERPSALAALEGIGGKPIIEPKVQNSPFDNPGLA